MAWCPRRRGSPRSLSGCVEPRGTREVLTANGAWTNRTLRNPTTAHPADAAGEAVLLARTAQGDREAFERLYFLFHRRLARFLMRVTRHPHLAEEIINDTMLVVWQRAADFRGDSHPSTWILGIAYRRALKALSREPREAPGNASPAEVLPDPVALQGLARHAELSDWLDAALGRLSAEHRLTIELAYVLGLSCEEISGITECPVNTVKTRMFYARQKLRELLAELGGSAGGEEWKESS
jgi:RNA polymerase sigma-70 factor (ECF subfamily)